jgi:hypothetical protein
MSISVTAELSTQAGTYAVQLTIPSNAINQLQVYTQELTASPVTIPVPPWALGVIIEPSVANAHSLLYAEHSGDTPRNISPISPSVVAFDAANLPADIYVESSGSDTTYTVITFF